MAITIPSPDARKTAEFTFDYIIVPLGAFSLVDAFVFPEVAMLPSAISAFNGWIVGIGVAWLAHKWAKTSPLFK